MWPILLLFTKRQTLVSPIWSRGCYISDVRAQTTTTKKKKKEVRKLVCLPAGSFFSVSCFPRAFCSLLFLVQDDFELLVVKRFVTNTLYFVMFCLRGCRGGELRTVSFLSALCFLFSIWRSSAGKTKSLFVFVVVVVSISFLVSAYHPDLSFLLRCVETLLYLRLFCEWLRCVCTFFDDSVCDIREVFGSCFPTPVYSLRCVFSSISNFPNSRLHRAAPVLSFFPPFTSLCWNNNAAEK